MRDTDNLDDLEKEIRDQDPSFAPPDGSGAHPYRKVFDHTLYPELKAIDRGKTVEHKVLDTHVNLRWLLSHFGAVIRNNLMKRRWEIDLPDQYIFEEDSENSAINRIEYLATINDMPIKRIPQHLKMIAEENNFHPIVDCIQSRTWDGVSRLHDFIDTLKTDDRELTRTVVTTWMCSAVAAIFAPYGHVSHGVLVLQGKQKLGKTGWIKRLDPANCEAVREGANLDPANKDDVMRVLEYWIVELGELDSTFRKDIARLKAFITSSTDHIRAPYAQKATRYYRRTVFAGSVNSDTYLVDETGNRRWWTIPVVGIDFSKGFDMQQVWAEVYALWNAGHPTDLDDDTQEKINENNRQFEKNDPIKEKLMTSYDWTMPLVRHLSSTQIMQELGYVRPSRAETTACGKLVKELNGCTNKIKDGVVRHAIPNLKMGNI